MRVELQFEVQQFLKVVHGDGGGAPEVAPTDVLSDSIGDCHSIRS